MKSPVKTGDFLTKRLLAYVADNQSAFTIEIFDP
jgi:hypothetical protein